MNAVCFTLIAVVVLLLAVVAVEHRSLRARRAELHAAVEQRDAACAETGRVRAAAVRGHDELRARRREEHAHADTRAQLRAMTAERDAARGQADELRGERDAQGLRDVIGRLALLHTKDGTVRGVVVALYDDCYAVEQPEWLQGAAPAVLGGDRLLLPRAMVTMIQRLAQADEAAS